jgi:hypothetical protein
MSLRYKTFDEYRNAVAPHLDAMIAARRDPECEDVLAHAFLLFSFVIEDMQAKATKNKEILNQIGIMLVELQDVLRGVVHGMNVVSPVVIAALLRVAFEVRCNLQFIFSRPDPGLFADRYRRFARVSELAYDESLAPEQRLIKPQTRQDILKACAEWITVKPNGELHFGHNWTHQKEFRSVKQRAEALGLASDYRAAYAATSQYVHGTALLWNGYRGPDGSRDRGVALSVQPNTMSQSRNRLAASSLSMYTGIAFTLVPSPIDRM